MPAAPYGGAGGWGRFSVDTAMTSGLAGVGSDLGAGGLYSPAPPGAVPPERVLLIHACVAALAAYGVERLLDGVDACVYLLDYTKLKTQDEASIFQRLKQVNPALVRRLSQRFFFVVNKVSALRALEHGWLG
ncbi:uncharacterized protein HaLaN_20305 [Haematococcus lacustris]|uniref:Uncharacterized protein n=1 Tax=Haematococcus lacustris TaxID=44745 RepID=A0A6A0A1E3_HAELA|nr:uncharacterized protein HaLaN_20305 [Haematococcus lacustris]